MEKTIKNIPKLRFFEYRDSWSLNKLGELSDISKLAGFEYSKHVVYKDEGKIIALRALNVKNNKLDLSNVKYIDESNFGMLNRSKLYIGDLLFTYIGANIGDVALVNENDRFYLAPNVSRIRPIENKLISHFIIQYFNQNKFINKEIRSYIASSSQPALSMENIRKFRIFLPALPEQQKIAAFLTTVDDKIEQLSKKKELLEQYKKGIMQQTFSQQIRFKDEKGKDFPDWEEKKIKDVFTVTRGYVLAVNKMEQVVSKDFNFPVYSSQTKNNGLTGFYKEYLYENAITWTTDGANAGDVKFRNGKFYCTNVCGVLISKEGNANKCIAEMINKVSRKYVSYVGNPKLMNNTMSAIKLYFPVVQEQQVIASFLSKIDEKIDQVIKQIEKTKEFKKGLLQKMFV